MSLIARKASLIIDSVARENPSLPIVPTVHNCWVWHFRYEDDENGWCYIRGRAGSGLTGKRLVKYRKLDIAVLLQGCSLMLPRQGNGVSSYLASINAMFGLDLTTDDIIESAIPEGATYFTLELKSNHTLYRGKVDFAIGIHTDKLGSVILARDLEVPIDTYNAILAMPGSLLTLGHDYSDIGNALTAYGPSYYLTDTRSVVMAQLLNSVDKVPWSSVENTMYSLFGSTVIYNGNTKDVTDPRYSDVVNTTYDKVMVIEPMTGATLFGPHPIVFHYNLYAAART